MIRYFLLAAALAYAPGASAAGDPYCKDERFPNAPRCFMVLELSTGDRGSINIVYVDNASSLTNSEAADLVMAADRSTQNGDITVARRKGLMRSDDRICVTDRYLAWFDYSTGDGTWFDPAVYSNFKDRAGALAGFWTLDPATHSFRHLRPSPDGSGGKWARNELISGSASPNGEVYWWDPYGPPIEHTFASPTTNDPQWAFYLFTYEYAKQSPKSDWRMTADGSRDAGGVHYATSALMTSWRGKVDIVDGEDDVDIKNSVRASVEYICGPDDITVVWRFRPEKADIVVNNTYVILWLAYIPGIDGTSCDQYYPDGRPLPGNQWPGPVYGTPRYARASETLMNNVAFKPNPPGSVNELPIQAPCNRRNDGTYPDYHNNSLGTFPPYHVRAGTWMELGEVPGLPPGSPGFRITVLDEPLTGAGTESDPERIAWKDIGVAHEDVDSTIVFGPGSVNEVFTLRAGRWYQSAISIAPLR